MKRKKVFLILSIVFTALALICLILGVCYYNFKMNMDDGFASVVFGLFISLATVALTPMVGAFGALGGVFSALALKKQEVKALYITILASVSFIFGLIVWIYIMTMNKGFSTLFVGWHFGMLAVVLTFWVIVFGILGVVFSVLAIKKQEAENLHSTTLAVSSVLTAVTVGWLVFLYCLSFIEG